MNNILDRVKAPAICLLIVGALNLVLGLLTLLSGLLRLTGIVPGDRIPTDEAERMGYYIGTFGGYTIALLGLIIAPFIINGAIKMLKGKGYKSAKIAAILAIVPFISCCFIIGIPVGIWVLKVLSDSEVKAFFNREPDFSGFQPPMPPTF